MRYAGPRRAMITPARRHFARRTKKPGREPGGRSRHERGRESAPASPVGRALALLRHQPMLALLVFVPIVIIVHLAAPGAHRALFLLSVLAVVPLAGLMSHATESVAAKTGEMFGGLLNATLGNLTELIIAVAALRAEMYDLVKASLAGAIVTNSLFMMGGSFLLGGLRHRVQEFNKPTARVQSGMLVLATIALLVPSAVGRVQEVATPEFMGRLSLGLSVLLLLTYGLGLLFSLGTHREFFAAPEHDEAHGDGEEPWPMGLAIGVLAGVTVALAFVAEIFVGSVQEAASSFGMSQAFVGLIVVSLVGAAAEIAAAFSAARKNHMTLSVGIAMGSSAQIALFVAPVLVLLSYALGPAPMDLHFQGGQVLMVLLATLAVSMTTNSGHSAWYTGVQLLAVYAIFAVTLYLLP